MLTRNQALLAATHFVVTVYYCILAIHLDSIIVLTLDKYAVCTRTLASLSRQSNAERSTSAMSPWHLALRPTSPSLRPCAGGFTNRGRVISSTPLPACLVSASCLTAPRTDSLLATMMLYAINTGMLSAICVLGSLVSTVVAPNTQFELFFLLLLPGRTCCSHRSLLRDADLTTVRAVYVNSYLGSLNTREVIRHTRAQTDAERGNGTAREQLRFARDRTAGTSGNTLVFGSGVRSNTGVDQSMVDDYELKGGAGSVGYLDSMSTAEVGKDAKLRSFGPTMVD
jgi:hypothetical protein